MSHIDSIDCSIIGDNRQGLSIAVIGFISLVSNCAVKGMERVGEGVGVSWGT